MSVNSKMTALMDAIRSKAGISGLLSLDTAKTAVDSIQTGITPSGSITLTSENTYDVTEKASAVVDFSATRANLAEAVTAKGVDTLPTSSFDTIATNIGLISGGGGGGLEKIGTATTNPSGGSGGYGEIVIPAETGFFLLCHPNVTPNNTNRIPFSMIIHVDTATSSGTAAAMGFNYGGNGLGAAQVHVGATEVHIDGISAVRLNTACTYDLYKV